MKWVLIANGGVRLFAGLLCLGVILFYGVWRVALEQNTNLQPFVRANIIHQAPRVIANNEQLHLLCADIKTASALFAQYRQMTGSEAQTNATGAQAALQDDRDRYDVALANPDVTVGIDHTLPATSAGCLK